MLKFIHAADIHLDSPLKGLEDYEGAPVEEIRAATRRALENLVKLAIEEQVDFVLIAGDVYDGDCTDYNTGLFFTGQLVQLREAGIPVYLIAGNHDAANKMSRSLKLPDNTRMLSHEEPETVLLEELRVAIHGQSFASQAVTDDLSQGYPEARKGMFNIGMLHTSATGREDGLFGPVKLPQDRCRATVYTNGHELQSVAKRRQKTRGIGVVDRAKG
jgi:exonuclease SbcD